MHSGRRTFDATTMRRVPPHAWFVVSAVFHYLGPSFAVLLFARVQVLGVAWLRIASAALILGLWRRPQLTLTPTLVAWGAVLAGMNAVFYLAIDRLPLGTVAAIEFLPVVVLAALGARTPRNLQALALAVAGVYLLTGVRVGGEALGFVFAFANAGLFALYIVLGHRVAQEEEVDGIDGLALSMIVAFVVATPIGGWQAAGAFGDPVAIAAGVGVGVCSSVIPYVTDQLAMRQLPRATYALMVSLLPAVATVVGLVVLAQVPSTREAAGVALVIAGVALHRERPGGEVKGADRAPSDPDPAPV
jgi:inner membrane transporter RhtA